MNFCKTEIALEKWKLFKPLSIDDIIKYNREDFYIDEKETYLKEVEF